MTSERSNHCSTFVELLRHRATHQPDLRGYVFLADGQSEEGSLTYRELDRQARAIGMRLQSAGMSGERVLLLYPPGLEFIAAFFGCLYAGAVAVPAYPPRQNRNLLRIHSILHDAQPKAVLTTASVAAKLQTALAEMSEPRKLFHLATDGKLDGEEDWRETPTNCDSLAFLQYTSGSTGLPKGVMLSHGNLMQNAMVVRNALEHEPDDKYVSWLPTFHDMGMMAGILQPLFSCIPVVLMPPISFLQRPLLWLKAISKYRATTSGAPNFAYDMCVTKLATARLESLDLSCWSVAFNGAEPVRSRTLREFAKVFEPHGFRWRAFYSCYGLAEATLMVTGSDKQSAPVIKSFQASALEEHLVKEVAAESEGAKSLVGCGHVLPGQKLIIVDPDTLLQRVAGEVGEVWVSSASVAGGYWQREEETKETFKAYLGDTKEGPFLRTGDTGFLLDGELFITGRLKDLIIIRGSNHYPQDIEFTVEQSDPALRAHQSAAFAAELDDEERLVVMVELDARRGMMLSARELENLAAKIRRAIAEEHELHAYGIAFLRPNTIPKTSSGKIQRFACRDAYLNGTAGELFRSVTNEEKAFAVLEVTLSRDSLLAADPEERQQLLESWLRQQVARSLKISPLFETSQPLVTLGLDSLSAIELKHQIEESFSVELSLDVLFEETSVERLATEILRQLETGTSAAAEASALAVRDNQYPASYIQEALYFLHDLAPASGAYNIAFAARITSELNVGALHRAFQTLSDRHASLRTTYHARDGKIVQQIHPQLSVTFVDTDASDFSSEALQTHIKETANQPFDLSRGPVFKINLFTRSRREHVMLITVHHIAMDGWALWTVLEELRVLYTAEQLGVRADLAELHSQYTDYVRWQEDLLASPTGQRQRDYWHNEFNDGIPILNLPTTKLRPQSHIFNGRTHSFGVDEELGDLLRSFAAAEGVTLYVVLLAAFQLLLHLYTGQDDILVGSPVSGRSRPQFRGVVGCFMNPVGLKVDFSSIVTFKTLLSHVCQKVRRALENQDYPSHLLATRIQPDRAPGSQLFQATFIWQKPHVPAQTLVMSSTRTQLDLHGLMLEIIPLERRFARSDLELEIVESDQRLGCSFQYNADVFDSSLITRMAVNFQALLRGVAADPAVPLSHLSVPDAKELSELLHDWSNASRKDAYNATVVDLLRQTVEKVPNAIAAVDDGVVMTFGTLDQRAGKLASLITEASGETRRMSTGFKLVGLMLEPGHDLLVGMVGILKAGSGFVPIDPESPMKRTALVVEDCHIRILVTQERFRSRVLQLAELSTCLEHVIFLDGSENEPAQVDTIKIYGKRDYELRNVGTKLSGIDSFQPVYVIFTSGSTGTPKGVPITHDNLLPILLWGIKYFGLGQHTKVLQNLSYWFDFGVFELLTTLLCGGTLYFFDKKGVSDVGQYAHHVNKHSINTIHTTPTFFREVIAAGGKLESLDILHLGGEALSRDIVKEISEVVGEGCILYNGYGPTEAAVNCSIFKVGNPSDAQFEHANIPIGKATAHNSLYILNKHLSPVPVGAPGELYVGGTGVAMGYVGRPDLTAERFVSDPFSNRPGARLYRTGDLVRYLPDGNIEFLGRIDQQVKLRGFRIELGEIEVVLGEHPDVRKAVVLAREDTPGRRQLVGYVVLEKKNAEIITAGDLRRFLKERLPDYMVPAALVIMDALPLTPNGKIDRAALLIPDLSEHEAETEFVGPKTPVEDVIASICAEVMGLRRVSVNDNLFDLGCHSLLATKIIARLREAMQIELPLIKLFESPSVAGLAEATERARQSASQRLPPIETAPRGDYLPLSFAQERIWFLDQLSEHNTSYYIPRALRIKGRLDVAVVERAFSELINRHEILRTSFPAVDGRPVQIIHPPYRFHVNTIDLNGINQSEREAAIRELILREGQRPFDLAQLPLLRVTLLRVDENEHVLVLCEHHLIHDGWSQGVFLGEFLALYKSFARGEPSPLTELPLQYADFVCWQRQWWQGELLETQLCYWKKQLSGAPPVLELPTDRPRPPTQSFKGAEQTLHIPAQLAESLRALSRRQAVTLFMTMLAAFKVLLHRYTGQEDIVVGSGIANRRSRHLEGMLGMIINTVVMRTDLSGDPPFEEFLKRVREVCLAAYEHQDMPFEKLVEELRPARNLSHLPLFQVLFSFLDTPMTEMELPGLTLEVMNAHNQSAKCDLNIVFIAHAEQRFGLTTTPGESGITVLLEYSTDIFDDQTIKQMLGHFQNLLEGIVEDPSRRISALPLLAETEQERLLVQWSGSRSEYPRDQCIDYLFEEQVTQARDAIAVICESERLTYGELDERATRLARYLRGRGAGVETRVAVMLERSVEMVVALLAILKAGGTYVPLDPSYPTERLSFMLNDVEAPLVLTQQKLLNLVPMSYRQAVVCLDNGEIIAPEEVQTPAALEVNEFRSPEHLAYIMYTSGSTGTPKGVSVTHRGVVRLVKGVAYADFGPANVFLQFAPISFDASTFEIWGSLLNGAQLVLAPPGPTSLEQLGHTLQRYGVTTLWLTAGLFQQMVEERLEDLKALRQLLAGGDVLPVSAVERFLAAADGCELINGYGPTENTTFTCCYSMRGPQQFVSSVPIGRPVSNTQIYLLDPNMQPVPRGVSGQLYIGGDGLARGYFNRPELTAEKFLPDPFSREPGARLYRTGDNARYLVDGQVEFLGRSDDQVKVRGFRVELGEVECALLRHSAVRGAVAMATDEGNGTKQIAAYVVAGEALDTVALREYLRQQLPGYMIPSAIVQLEEFPLTANGKVDRRALPPPNVFESARQPGYVAPRYLIEKQLVSICEDVLGRASVGVTDNFFEIGGHSLRATQIASRIYKDLQVTIPLRTLFEYPTIEGWAREIVSRVKTTYDQIEPVATQPHYPLSHAQKRLWILHKFSPQQTAYNLPGACVLEGEVDREAFEKAFRMLVTRHESLRTTFTLVDGEPRQLIHPPDAAGFRFEYVDMRGLADNETKAREQARDMAKVVFDLENGPLLRVRLLRLSDRRYVFLFTMHHIASDGWSLTVLVDEVLVLYSAFKNGRENPLPPLRIQYKDYVSWQDSFLQGEQLGALVHYWTNRLGGKLPVLNLPLDYPRPPVQTFAGQNVPFKLSAELTAQLLKLAQQQQTTLFAVLLSAYNATLYHITGQRRIILGTSVAGRNHSDLENLIGFFVNTLAISVEINPQLRFSEFLKVVHSKLLDDLEHQELPFDLLIERLEIKRDLSTTPVFQGRFVFNDFGYREVLKSTGRAADLNLREFIEEPGGAKFDLSALMRVDGDCLIGALEYRTDLFKSATVEQIAKQFQKTLQQIVDRPEQRIEELEFQDEQEQRALQSRREKKMQSALSLLKAAGHRGSGE